MAARGLHELLLGLRAHEGAALLRQHGAREPLARAAAAALQQRAQRIVHARGQPLGRVRRDLVRGRGRGRGRGRARARVRVRGRVRVRARVRVRVRVRRWG